MNISPHLVHLRITEEWDYEAYRLDSKNTDILYAKLMTWIFSLTSVVQLVPSVWMLSGVNCVWAFSALRIIPNCCRAVEVQLIHSYSSPWCIYTHHIHCEGPLQPRVCSVQRCDTQDQIYCSQFFSCRFDAFCPKSMCCAVTYCSNRLESQFVFRLCECLQEVSLLVYLREDRPNNGRSHVNGGWLCILLDLLRSRNVSVLQGKFCCSVCTSTSCYDLCVLCDLLYYMTSSPFLYIYCPFLH